MTRADRIGRATVSLAVALAAGTVAFFMARRPYVVPDFAYYHRAAWLWSQSVDPYTVPLSSTLWPMPDRLFYPLPALIVVLPLAGIQMALGSAIFVALPAGLLAWRLSTDGLWRLLILASPSLSMAAALGQWSPWLMLAVLNPVVGFVLACKPTLGVACFAHRPSRSAFYGAFVLVAVSIALMPGWPFEWLSNIRAVVGHPPPLFTFSGGILALAVLRWRDPDARLLLAMASVPQLLFFADQLPLLLVARTPREAAFLVTASWVTAAVWYSRHFAQPEAVPAASAYVLLGCYLPALYVVLRRRAVTYSFTWTASAPER